MAEALISPKDCKAVRNAALEMPEAERTALVDELIDSLDAADPKPSAEWMAIMQRRLEDYKSGKTIPIPGEQVRQGARQRVRL